MFMSKLVQHLKDDHKQIAKAFEEVKKLGIGTKEGVEKLNSVKALLLAHLKLEDVKLYPALRQAAEKNAQLRSTVTIFAKDMELISKAALDFFDKYSKSQNTVEFARDFGSLFAVLSNRINREESTLYAEYQKLGLD